METIVPVDPVKLVRTWLVGSYPWPVTVTKNRPNPTAGRVVTVRRSGGVRIDMVTDGPWLSVECFADTDDATAQLAHWTWGRLFAMTDEIIDGVQCYRVQQLGGPSDFPDAEAEQSRFVLSVQASFRAAA